MSDYIQMAKGAAIYLCPPIVAGCFLAVRMLRGKPQVDELSLAERGGVRHLVALLLPATVIALAESLAEEDAWSPVQIDGLATKQEARDEEGLHQGWEDTSGFQEEQAFGTHTIEKALPMRVAETDKPVLENQSMNAEVQSVASSEDASRFAVLDGEDSGSEGEAATTVGIDNVSAAEIRRTSDAAVYGAGAGFDYNAHEIWPAEIEDAELTEDHISLERASNLQNKPLTNPQFDPLIVGGLHTMTTPGTVAHPSAEGNDGETA